MADGQNKELKFRVAVDERSFARFKRVVEEMRSEIDQLSSSLGKVGGLFTGGTRAGGPGTTTSVGSTAVGGARQGGGGGGGGGGIADTLTKTLVANKNLLKGIANESKDVARVMRDAINDSLDKQTSKVKSLRTELKELTAEYTRLKTLGGGSGSGYQDAALARVRGAMGGKLDDLNKANDAVTALKGGGGSGGARGGIMQAISSMTGIPPNILTATGAIGAGVGLARYAWNGVSNLAQANLQYRMHQPFMPGERGAGIGSSLGQYGMALHGGDVARAFFMRQAFQDPNTHRLFSSGADITRDKLMQRKAGMGMTGTTPIRQLIASGIAEDTGSGGRGLTAQTYGMLNGPGAGTQTQAAIAMAEQRNMLDPEKAQDLVRMAELKMQANPRLASVFNNAYAESPGRLSQMRAAGIGSGLGANYLIPGKLLKTPGSSGNYFVDWQAKILNSGFMPEEATAMRQAVAGAAGRGLMGAGDGLLGMASGGLGNVAQLFGVGAQFGGGRSAGGNAFLRAVQSGIGSGGMDVTAGSQVAGLVAAGMTGGNFLGSTGTGAMQGLLSAGFTGTPGGDMRMARMLGAGMGEYGRNLSGGTDGLQQGINLLAANSAVGGGGWYAKKALMGIDPTQMIDMMRTGKLPQHLADQGVTMQGVREYNRYRNQFAFSRYIDAEGGGSAVSQAVAGAKSAGGVGNYLHSLGLSNRTAKGRKAIDHVLTMLGTARQATEGGSTEANVGALYAEIAGDKGLTVARKGSGAGDVVSKNDPQREVLKNMADKLVNQEKMLLNNQQDFTTTVKTLEADALAFDDATKKLVDGAKNFDGMLAALSQSMVSFMMRVDPKGGLALQLNMDREKAQKALNDQRQKATAPGGKK